MRYGWIENAANEHATKTYVDDEKKKDFVAGASWMANRLCNMMREHPMMSGCSKSTQKVAAQAQIDVFWEAIAEIEKEGRSVAERESQQVYVRGVKK